MLFLIRTLDAFVKYRILTIVACVLSIFTCVKLIIGATKVDYFIMIPIPLLLISIFGYLGVAVLSKKRSRQLFFTAINIKMCAISLMYIPVINNLADRVMISYN